MNNKKATLREKLYLFRCSKKLTQEGFAKSIGYKRDTYGKVENGERTPTMKFCVAISKKWAIPLTEVLAMMEFDKGTEE